MSSCSNQDATFSPKWEMYKKRLVLSGIGDFFMTESNIEICPQCGQPVPCNCCRCPICNYCV